MDFKKILLKATIRFHILNFKRKNVIPSMVVMIESIGS